MKRRLKMIASLSMMLFMIYFATVAVIAAVSQTVNIGTNITYTSVTVEGTLVAGYSLDGGNTTHYYNASVTGGGNSTTPVDNSITVDTTTLNSWEIPPLNFEITDGILHDIVFTFTFTNTSTLNNVNMGIKGPTQFPVGGNIQTKIIGNNITNYRAKQDIMAGAITINGTPNASAYTSGQVISLNLLDEIALVPDKYYVATADLYYQIPPRQPTIVCYSGSIFSINNLNSWSTEGYNNYEQRRDATLEDLFEIFVNTAIVNTADYTNDTVTIIGTESTESFTITLSILNVEEAVLSDDTPLSFGLLLTGSGN